ncbi:hypothetical protein HF086_002727 [Spodoptera exigua]|uniref:MULE transposase domain-containing protein n=1 Tax=Spodoptera exigua TaxID=7107 RepID=A0A922M9M5_SPOEX|nr:hypothetical protein HF086_002727 [Spodoptera exigua]
MSEQDLAGSSSGSGKSVLVYIKRKHGTVLLHGGRQYYTKRAHESGLVIWSCSQRKLKCSGVLRIKNDQIIEETLHKCTPNFEKNEIDASIYNLKQKLIAPTFPSVPKTYNAEVACLKDANPELLSNLPTFSSVKSSLYRYRNSAAKLPKIQCKTVEEVQVPSDYRDFLLADYTYGNTRIIVFCTETAREIICQVEDFYADGTFKSCSPPFDQLYTIHGDIGSTANHTNLMPLVYALMSNRTTESYKILFMLIKAEIPKWSPKRIKTDYERAAMKAIVDVFPCVELKGCYFHFNKAIWAKGRELSLTNTKDIKKKTFGGTQRSSSFITKD